jgi:addiction module RelE/StbE family toxin
MILIYHSKFKKKYSKLRTNEKQKFKERRNLFLVNPFDPILNNHALNGKYLGYRSINIGGDLRAVFKMLKQNLSIFADLDTHSNLYK